MKKLLIFITILPSLILIIAVISIYLIFNYYYKFNDQKTNISSNWTCDNDCQEKIKKMYEDASKINDLIEFGFVFQEHRNLLNTSINLFIKDMGTDGPPISTKLYVSKQDLTRIYNKMIEINFFDYPDKFSSIININDPNVYCLVDLSSSVYYFKVKDGIKIKELWYDSKHECYDKTKDFRKEDNTFKIEKVEKLKELIKLIWDVIQSNENYQKLPPRKLFFL